MAYLASCIVSWLRRTGGVGTLVLGSAASLWGQGGFGGPSILSRPTSAMLSPEDPPFLSQFYGSVNYSQELGLLPLDVNAPAGVKASPTSADLSSLETNFGALIRRRLRRQEIGFGYVGTYRNYFGNGGFSNSDNLMSLEYRKQLAQHIQWDVRASAGAVSRAIGGVLASSLVDSQDPSIPVNDVYDSRFYFGRISTDVVYQQSARLSYRVAADALQMKRSADALLSVGSIGASGDIAYRISRSQTIDVQYGYEHLGYNQGVGTFDVHIVGGGYSKRLGRYWELALQGGFYRIESFGNQQVALDPAVAALLGQNSGLQLVYGVRYLPQLDAQMSRVLQRGKLSFGYSRHLNPGNGLLALSSESVGSIGYTRVINQRLNLIFDARYSQLSAIRTGYSNYNTVGASIGSRYRLWRGMSWNTNFSYRSLDASDLGQSLRSSYRLSTGISFQSSEIPLRLR